MLTRTCTHILKKENKGKWWRKNINKNKMQSSMIDEKYLMNECEFRNWIFANKVEDTFGNTK